MKLKLALLASAALLLASCGGGESYPGFSRMVNFGDSLSDVGTYRVGTIAALGGGEFNVNGPTAVNWTDVLAASARVDAPCAAQTGLLPNIPGLVGAAVTNVAGCSNYAQGSARVTNPLGPNAAGLQAAPFNQVTLGLMATPLTSQVANHLSRGGFTGNELVTVMAGGNDIFMNMAAVGAAATGGTAAAGAAAAAGWSASVQAAVVQGGAAAVGAAANAAGAAMAQAGAELAALVRSQILANGARYVVVVNLPDVSLTPYAAAQSAETRGLINQLVNAFNAQLAAGLPGIESGVLYVDFYTQQRAVAANPAAFGITNATGVACDPASPNNPLQGSSLACTAASVVAGDISGYQYADSVHPTSLGYRLIANYVIARMQAVGWLAP